MKTSLAACATLFLGVIAYFTARDYLDDQKAAKRIAAEMAKSRIEAEEEWKRMEQYEEQQLKQMMDQTIKAGKETDAALERMSRKFQPR